MTVHSASSPALVILGLTTQRCGMGERPQAEGSVAGPRETPAAAHRRSWILRAAAIVPPAAQAWSRSASG